jgi:hypothetical protein
MENSLSLLQLAFLIKSSEVILRNNFVWTKNVFNMNWLFNPTYVYLNYSVVIPFL